MLFTWNYSEAGHGKGAPDGTGGTLKRTADRIVAQGKDVENFKWLFNVLLEHCPGVKMFEITDKNIHFKEDLNKGSDKSKPFLGTLKVHQVVFNSAQSYIFEVWAVSNVKETVHTFSWEKLLNA